MRTENTIELLRRMGNHTDSTALMADNKQLATNVICCVGVAYVFFVMLRLKSRFRASREEIVIVVIILVLSLIFFPVLFGSV